MKDEGYVYAIRCQDTVKIGYAACVKRRLSGIACGNPHPLKLERLLRAPRDLCPKFEREIQNALWRSRVRGEWFRADALLVKELFNRIERENPDVAAVVRDAPNLQTEAKSPPVACGDNAATDEALRYIEMETARLKALRAKGIYPPSRPMGRPPRVD